MKRFTTLLLAGAILLTLGLSGCSSTPEASPPAEQTSSAEAPPPSAESSEQTTPVEQATASGTPESGSYELIDAGFFGRQWNLNPDELGIFSLDLSTHDPSTSMKSMFLEEWAQLIYEATNGGVSITIYNGGTLAAPGEALTAVEMGTADIAWIIGSSFTTQLPITCMFNLACLGLDECTMATSIMWDLYDDSEAFGNEYSSSKLLMLFPTGGTPISANVRITSMKDLEGLKIRALGGTGVDILTRLGASPITMPPNDVYDSLSKNVIDGYTIEWSGIKTYNFYEATEYYGTDSLWTVPMAVIMNNDSFNSLPAEYQEVIEYYSGREMSLQQAYQWQVENETCAAELARPEQFCSFTGGEWAKIKDIAATYNLERAEALTTDTFDGLEFLEKIYEKVDSYADYQYYRFS